jgi:hypothetical protein
MVSIHLDVFLTPSALRMLRRKNHAILKRSFIFILSIFVLSMAIGLCTLRVLRKQ